jgi:LPXTG-motif cell wall-anchored protein
MKATFFIPVLLLLLLGTGTAYEYRMPVNIQSTINPSVLMPGDEAVLAIELQNGAAAYGSGGTAGAGTPAAGTVLSTPINSTTLKGTNDIRVISADYHDLGMIGPNDKITIYYKIKAGENTSGTYFLDFGVEGGYDMIPINRGILIKVDPAAVSLARADASGGQSISLNVANPRENTINAVTIVPTATGIRFSPDEYYIGTMDPDEVFTISFGVEPEDPSKPISSPVNLSFISRFKNGDAWHESGAYVASYMPPRDSSNQNYYLLAIGVAAALIIAAGGFYLYRRRKSSAKQQKDSRLA